MKLNQLLIILLLILLVTPITYAQEEEEEEHCGILNLVRKIKTTEPTKLPKLN